MRQWYPMYPGDFIRDTIHLSAEDVGCYIRLINHYYSTGKPIPDDIQVIRKIIGESLQKTRKKLEVFDNFFERKDGFLRHERIDKELAKSKYLNEKLSEAGRKGGKKTQAQAQARPQPQPQPHKDISRPHPRPCDIQQKTEGENESPEPTENKPKRATVPYQAIVDLYHEILPELPRCEIITTKRKGQIGARHRDLDNELRKWGNFFKYIRQSDFLMGKTQPVPGRKQFKATLEWVTNESNFAKISEEQYHG